MRTRLASTSLLSSLAALSAVLLLAPGEASANAQVTIVNKNAPGVGFNDPTPVAPVGGNTGTTLGQQRLIAFQHAASIWSSTLDSNVGIQILATFEPLTCTPTSATLGSAGTLFIFSDFGGATVPPFPGPEFTDTWYHQALASKRAGTQLNPTNSCTNSGATCTTDADWTTGAFCTNADIRARFNSRLDGNPACLGGIGWYLGLELTKPVTSPASIPSSAILA